MPRSLQSALLLISLLLATPDSGRAQQPIGPKDLVFWRIPSGADSTVVRQSLGQPDSISTAADPSQADPTLTAWWYGDLQIVFNGADVLGEWATGPSLQTARGIGVGASLSRVRAFYGDPSRTWTDQGGLVYVDRRPTADDRCLYFEASDGRITRVYVGYLVD